MRPATTRCSAASQSTGLTGSYGFGAGNLMGVTWFTRSAPETGEDAGRTRSRLNGAFNIPAWHMRLEGQINYDIEQQVLQQQQTVMNYNAQCYGLRLEFRDSAPAPGTECATSEIRFSLTLKNVGTFLDLNSRSSTVEP